jgi:DNA sulfur modification protein DndB
MKTLSTHNFPVIRGIQAGREYYVAMWNLRMVARFSSFDDKEIPAELRAQRVLNKARIPEMAAYICNNPKDYIFSALTVSIDSEVQFEPYASQGEEDRLGKLMVPMDAKFIINDGQHRRAAILEALEQKPALAYETIAVVFFLDKGLERCQQMFADLNRYAIRPSRSLSVLYDHRDQKAKLARMVIFKSEVFRDIVDMEKSSLAPRSRKLFTLSAFHQACAELVQGHATGNLESDAKIARDYWEAVAHHFPAWKQVREGKMPASEVREGFIHSHGIAIHALGRMGNCLLRVHPGRWKDKLKALAKIDWSRGNGRLWEGRALIGGRVSKVGNNVLLTSNVLKKALGLPLDEEESKVEKAINRGRK